MMVLERCWGRLLVGICVVWGGMFVMLVVRIYRGVLWGETVSWNGHGVSVVECSSWMVVLGRFHAFSILLVGRSLWAIVG
jgi:hypothetical protein